MSVEDKKFNDELEKAIDYAHKVTAEKGETSPKLPPPGMPSKKCGQKSPTSIKNPRKPGSTSTWKKTPTPSKG
jgi:hypothetical protein